MRYYPKKWEPTEVLTMEGLNQLSDNIDYIFRKSPRIIYSNRDGGGREENVKIATGKIVIDASNKPEASGRAEFYSFFTTGFPVVTTSLNTRVSRVLLTITGLNSLEPDSRGFIANLEKLPNDNNKPGSINKKSIVHWTAVGL